MYLNPKKGLELLKQGCYSVTKIVMETHLLNSSLDPSAISVQSSLLTSVAFYIQQLIIDAGPRNQTLVCHLPIIAIEDLHPVLRWQTSL